MPRPTLVSYTSGPAGAKQLNLEVSGVAGYSYVLQAALNLAEPIQWFPVKTNVCDSFGHCQFTVTNLTAPAVFYRIVWP
jgi:hypothetical protein